jgi:hypothetical protein
MALTSPVLLPPSPQVWKIGQVRPGDSIRFKKLTLAEAHASLLATDARISALRDAARAGVTDEAALSAAVAEAEAAAAGVAGAAAPDMPTTKPLLKVVPASDTYPGAEYRLAGVCRVCVGGGGGGGGGVGIMSTMCARSPYTCCRPVEIRF